jgi:DNA-directed RNA polymerase subunit M/transcription elongation factor TFIIS
MAGGLRLLGASTAMSSLNARAGDKLRCNKCGHTKDITHEWLADLLRRFFPTRSDETIYSAELHRFKCNACGANNVSIVDQPLRIPPEINPPEQQQWVICRQCGGDGGATGSCPRCGGTGWEQ